MEPPSGKKCIVNLRPLLVCAAGFCLGFFLYERIRFGGGSPADWLLPLLLFLVLPPFSRRRTLALLLPLVLFLGAGVLMLHLATERFLGGAEAGEYEVTGVVVELSAQSGYASVLLDELSFDGERQEGKLAARLSGSPEIGDRVRFHALVERTELSAERALSTRFAEDARYWVQSASYERAGKTDDLFARLRAQLHMRLAAAMGGEEAEIAFALLTGNSGGIDDGLEEEIRTGGIAHIFAVSGLHIGILYGALLFAFRPAGRAAALPALAGAAVYAALCGFPVSTVRALLMCAALAVYRLLGRKYDLLQSLSFAAIAALLLFPAQWMGLGFKLSFAACCGLALFQPVFFRLFSGIPLFGGTLASSLAAQIAVAPILLEAFGFVSVWGTALNLLILPFLPALFLLLFGTASFALAFPAAAGVLILPQGALSLLVWLFAVCDFSLVISGFSLGAGGAVYAAGCALLSCRVRMTGKVRAAVAAALAALFCFAVAAENVVIAGCKIVAYTQGDGDAVLFRTSGAAVLVIDGDLSLSACEDFLARRYGGELTAVLVLADDPVEGINRAAFLPARMVCAKEYAETGLHHPPVFGDSFSFDGMLFRFESREKLSVQAEDAVVEVDFSHGEGLGADLFLQKGGGGLKFYLRRGIIVSL